MSTPCGSSAAGSAPTTSARPPVLTSGKTSEATERTFIVYARRSIIVWVIRQMPLVGAPEALGVECRILADHETLRDEHAAIDDDLL